MKLHLNLTLRRAVLAAMATMAVYTTQADETTSFPGGISNGQYLVTGTTTTSVSYNSETVNYTPDIFIGGGKEGNADLTLTDGASITANSVNVGSSLNAITGTLTVGAAPETDTETSAPKASVTTNQLNVGCYAGQGILVINKDAEVTVFGNGSNEFDSSLNLGYHTTATTMPDTITIAGGTLTVGSRDTKNAKVSIGALNSITSTMEIKDGGSAEFYGQTIVGENGMTYGTIAVKDGATLNMDGNTVVGLTSSAYGAIIGKGAVDEEGDYDTSISAGNMTVGDKGNGSIELYNAQLTADAIAVAKQTGSYGEIFVGGEYIDGPTVTTTKTIGELSTKLLSIGQAGEGEVTIADGSSLSATDITLGYASTGNGTLSIGTGATIGKITNLVVGYEGKGTLITESDITADYTTINQAASSATVKNDAELHTGYLSILAGTLYIGEVSGEGETATTSTGNVTVTGATNTDANSKIYIASGSSLSTAGGTTYIDGKKYAEHNTLHGSINIAKAGAWTTYSSTTSWGIIQNDGNVSVNGTMAALQGIAGSGTTNVTEGSELQLTGDSSQNEIVNDGSITLLSNATLTSGPLTGTGTTNVGKDSELQLTGASSQNKIVNDGVLNVGTTDVAGSMAALQGITGTGTTNVAEGSKLQLTGASSQNKIVNNGVLNVGITDDDGKVLQTGTMAALITGDGTTNVTEDSELKLTGASSQSEIDNNGTITLQGAGRIDATTLSGTGTTTITIDGTTVATSEDLAIIEVGTLDGQKIEVDIDTDNGASLVGKTFNFVEVNEGLINLDQGNFIVDKGWTIDWDGKNISTGDTSTDGQQLSFKGGTDYMTFTKLGAIDTKTVEVELPKNVTIELEVVTETVLAEAKTGVEAVASETDTDVVVEKDTILHSAELSQGVDADQNEIRTNVVIGKDVESSGSGSTKVQNVVVNQKTTIDGGDAGSHDDKVKKETIGVSGVALVLDGKTDHKGKGAGAELGFNENITEGTLTTKDTTTNVTTKNEVKKIDIVQVEQDSDVTVTDMNMHSTHALTIGEGTTITFTGVKLHVGGTTDVNLTKEVEVKVYDENGKWTGETKTESVDSGAHLTTESTITKATVKIAGNSVVKFEDIDDANHNSQGSTTFAESEVEIDNTSTLGDNASHMQEIVFTDETSVKNSGNVNNAKFDNKSKLHNNNGTVDNVVISNGSHLTGKGNLKRVHVDKDSYFTVGSSPGKFTASELTVDGVTNFYLIVDSNDWENYKKTGDAKDLTADERENGAADGEWGAISQLVVDGSVTLNGEVRFTYQKWDPSVTDDNGNVVGGFVNLTEAETQAAREDLGEKFAEGSSIKFVTGNVSNLTLGSGFWVNEDTLPELEDGLFWDVSSLFNDCTVYVIGEILEEPTRIANTLVSAGETVLNFGRLAQKQAYLREAGTTRTWGSAIAMFDSIDSGSTTNGYDYSNWGAAVGIDHAFTKNTVVGVAFGCTWGENEAKEDNGYYSAGSIDQDAKMIGIYGVHKFQTKGLLNDVKLSAFAAYGMFENDSTRNGLKSGNTAKAEWDSDAWVLSASLSRDITTDSGVVFTPYVGVEYTTAGMDDFSEQGKSYAADYSADEDYSNLSVKVGVGVSKTYGSITPYANVAFISDVDRTAGEVTATGKRTITGKSALPGRNGFEIGVGATWLLTENLDVNAGYSAEIRDKATEHNARLGVGYTF